MYVSSLSNVIGQDCLASKMIGEFELGWPGEQCGRMGRIRRIRSTTGCEIREYEEHQL